MEICSNSSKPNYLIYYNYIHNIFTIELERATHSYLFFVVHEITPKPTLSINPDILFLSPTEPTESLGIRMQFKIFYLLITYTIIESSHDVSKNPFSCS